MVVACATSESKLQVDHYPIVSYPIVPLGSTLPWHPHTGAPTCQRNSRLRRKGVGWRNSLGQIAMVMARCGSPAVVQARIVSCLAVHPVE